MNFISLLAFVKTEQTVDGYIATEDKQGLLLYGFDGNRTFIRSISILLRVLGKLARSDIVKTFERNCFNTF
jgi:hypothetical protein